MVLEQQRTLDSLLGHLHYRTPG